MFRIRNFLRITPLNFFKILFLAAIIVILLGCPKLISKTAYEKKEADVPKLNPLTAASQLLLLTIAGYIVVRLFTRYARNLTFIILVVSLLWISHHLRKDQTQKAEN